MWRLSTSAGTAARVGRRLARVYAAGHLLFQRGPSVFARPFDAARLVFTGPERLLATQAGFFSVSDNGTSSIRPAGVTLSQLTWFDRRGRRTGTLGEPGQYQQVVLSPRGRRATVVRPDTQDARGNMDLWDVDLDDWHLVTADDRPGPETLTRRGHPTSAAWRSPPSRAGPLGVFVKDVNSGAEEPLVVWKEPVMVDQWTPDGQFIIFRNAGQAVWAVPVDGRSQAAHAHRHAVCRG